MTQTRRSRRPSQKRHILARAFGALLGVALVGFGARWGNADLDRFRAALILSAATSEENPDRGRIAAAHELALRATTLAPDDREAADMLVDTSAARLKAGTEAEASEVRDAASRALGLAPGNPFGWARLATSDQLSASPTSLGFAAQERGIALAPFEGALIYPRLSYCASWWDVLPAGLKASCTEQLAIGAAWDLPSIVKKVRRENETTAAGFTAMLGQYEQVPRPAG